MNKKHWLRSALSLLMALCLVLGTPVAALAAAEEVSDCPAVQAVYEAEFYGPKADQIVELVNEEVLPEYGELIGMFDDATVTSFIRSMMDEDDYKGMLEDLMTEFGMEITDANKDLIAAELCVIIRLCDAGKNEEAKVEIFRFALVELEGCPEASAPETAELYYQLYQISKAQGSDAALAKAHEKLDVDTDKDHFCDVCETKLGECADADKDHLCDVCEAELSECADADKDHACDICDDVLSDCEDEDEDGKCDICGESLVECVDADKDHLCDECGAELSKCADENKDHLCDICGTELSKCSDANKDHKCDTCGKEASKCEDGEKKDHKCDVCGKVLSECADADKNGKCDVCGAQVVTQKVVTRISGKERTATARKIADEVKTVLEVEKFDAIVYASGDAFPDALTGTYLANVENAPILLYRASGAGENLEYIKKNLAADGVVYILGGEKAVPASVEADLKTAGIKAVRLSGKTRFDTNIEILEAAGFVGGETVLVCTGYEYADSLSASATGMPILLVNNAAGKLTDAQSAYLKSLDAKCEFVIIGGKGAVSEALEEALKAFDANNSVSRFSGKTRYETSAILAAAYFPEADKAVLAYGREFADGLCGGSLGYALDAPIILVESGKASVAAEYAAKQGIVGGYVLGGTARVADATVRTVFALADTDQIVAK